LLCLALSKPVSSHTTSLSILQNNTDSHAVIAWPFISSVSGQAYAPTSDVKGRKTRLEGHSGKVGTKAAITLVRETVNGLADRFRCQLTTLSFRHGGFVLASPLESRILRRDRECGAVRSRLPISLCRSARIAAVSRANT
jgi:hypothetical protein